MANQSSKHWICVYPAYIDSELAVSEGRKVSKEIAVEKPNVLVMNQACKLLGFNAVFERKSYPRQQWVMGRVKIQLKDDNNQFVSQYHSRKEIMIALCKSIKEQAAKAAKAPQPKKKR
ncbi:Signal recognition particle 19 kDa protein [Entamoeba marina]